MEFDPEWRTDEPPHNRVFLAEFHFGVCVATYRPTKRPGWDWYLLIPGINTDEHPKRWAELAVLTNARTFFGFNVCNANVDIYKSFPPNPIVEVK